VALPLARRGGARRASKRWYQWAIRSRLEPVKKVARLVDNHLEGIVTAVLTGATTECVNVIPTGEGDFLT
jgi:transposase